LSDWEKNSPWEFFPLLQQISGVGA